VIVALRQSRRLNTGEIDIDDSPAITRIAMMLPLH
jgi:hypothetical protein